jgi:chromosome partitioning protein
MRSIGFISEKGGRKIDHGPERGGCDRAGGGTRPVDRDGVDLLPADSSLADATVILAAEVGRERRLREALDEAGGLLLRPGGHRPDAIAPDDQRPERGAGADRPVHPRIVRRARPRPTPGGRRPGPPLSGEQDAPDRRDRARTGREEQRTPRARGRAPGDVRRARVRGEGPRSIKVEEAHARHESVLTYAPKSIGAVAYRALAMEIVHG